MGEKVDDYLVQWREQREHENQSNLAFSGYKRDSYVVSASTPRFGSGEGKGVLNDSIRGYDLYIMVDVCNYSIEYSLCGTTNHMSPDDHYADLKRVIAAAGGKARRINVIMPFLYEGRQHRRASRESLDCAMALQELVNMGVSNIITFDAHDPRVQNSIPLSGFDNVRPTYQMLKALVRTYPDISLGHDDIMIVAPDEGAMSRCMYYASVLGIDLGMFYKRRNYSVVIDGKNPIEAHEYLGRNIRGKDVIVVDDMISSGDSILDVSLQLKEKGARRIFLFETFGLFCNGLDIFDKAYKEEVFTKIFTTNLIYRTPELLSREWYQEVNMCKYVAYIIDTLNHDDTISNLLNPVTRIHNLLEKQNQKIGAMQLTIDHDTDSEIKG